MKIVAIVGPSGSGKTTLAAGLVREFRRRGLSVAVVKHAPHGFDLDKAGKDSHVYCAAGAGGVALVADDEVAVVRRTADAAGVDPVTVARTAFGPTDVVMIEGGKSIRGLAKVEVVPPGGRTLLTPPEELLAVAADGVPPATGRPVFARSDAAGLAAFLITHLEDDMIEVRLEIDGREILLNAFVQSFIAETVRGMVKPLSGVPESPRTIGLTVGPPGAKPAESGGGGPSSGGSGPESA